MKRLDSVTHGLTPPTRWHRKSLCENAFLLTLPKWTHMLKDEENMEYLVDYWTFTFTHIIVLKWNSFGLFKISLKNALFLQILTIILKICGCVWWPLGTYGLADFSGTALCVVYIHRTGNLSIFVIFIVRLTLQHMHIHI